MSPLFNCSKKNIIFSPVNGNIIDIESVDDPLFSKKTIGNGLAIKPSDGHILSPCCGTINCILIEKHALFVLCEDKTQILLHLGLDTVDLNGYGFNCLVSLNQKVNIGDLLIIMNLKTIKQCKKDDTILVVIPNDNKRNIVYKNKGQCLAGKTTLFKYITTNE